MGIRAGNNKKDHLRRQGTPPALALVVDTALASPSEDPLRFGTSHPDKPCLVDLTVFKLGEHQPNRKGGTWHGPFTGRPLLIAELAPALHDQLAPLAEKSVAQYMVSLRAWWRLFDAIEATGVAQNILSSTVQLSDLHRQYALDKDMNRLQFSIFLRLANSTRTASGHRPLFWKPPADKAVNRHLPATWQTDYVRRTLKHRWYATWDRWALADELRQHDSSLDQQRLAQDDLEHARLRRNYLHFDAVIKATGHPCPGLKPLRMDCLQSTFYREGYKVRDMMLGRYPDGNDIRAAFHLCLATTGWNAAVLLSLDVSKPFIEAHPKDPSRYIMRGTKARAGGTEQVTEGLFKTQGSAGAVLQTLISRTEPLRSQLHRELKDRRVQLASLAVHSDEFRALERRVRLLGQGIRSPWLFVSTARIDIDWLTDKTFSTSTQRSSRAYLGDLIADLNVHQAADRQLARLTASDLRDAYAAHTYHASGGSILHVMKALGHRSPRSTPIYLNNTLLREEHKKLFGAFSEGLWKEMLAHGRVDPTVLAKLSRDGEANTEQRGRLKSYRTIMLSRIGVGCRDPSNPPRHIAPNFIPDGKAMCPVQRCTLCVENAIILPESLPGLCKRLAELGHLRSLMSISAFHESSFMDELENTELALLAFDPLDVKTGVAGWANRIANGTHRVMEFDGLEQKVPQ